MSQQQKESLVKKAEGRSTRATKKLLSETDPSLTPIKEQTRFLGKGRIEIKVVIDEKCHKELEELKSLLSHRNPVLSYRELFAILSEEALKKHDPRKKNTRLREEKIQRKTSSKARKPKDKAVDLTVAAAQNRGKESENFKNLKTFSEKPIISLQKLEQTKRTVKEKVTSAPKPDHKVKKITRTIPSCLRKYVWEKDKGQCTYVHHETKRRCASRHLLQIDHIQPFALGGKTEKENLRLLCAGHNRYRR